MANQIKQIRAVQLSRKRHWNQLVAMPDSSSNGSGSDGSNVTPSQRHSGDGVMTLNELQDLIDEVTAVGNGTLFSESLSVLVAQKDNVSNNEVEPIKELKMFDHDRNGYVDESELRH